MSSRWERLGENRTSRSGTSVSRGRRIYHQRVYDPMIDFSPGLDSANRYPRGLLHPISCKRRLLPEILVFNLAACSRLSRRENQRPFSHSTGDEMQCRLFEEALCMEISDATSQYMFGRLFTSLLGFLEIDSLI